MATPVNIDLDKIIFDSDHPIDKVVYTGSKTITNDGDSSDYWLSKIVQETDDNPYGKACFIRYRWSIDGGDNWQAARAHLTYSYTVHITSTGITSSPIKGLQAAVSCGVSDSTIYFRTANGYHGNVTEATPTSTPVYTPISQTFIIEYALFEIE